MVHLNWEKKGRIFDPSATTDWNYEYAQVPWAIEFDDYLRVYFTSRPPVDSKGQYVSYTFYADFDKTDMSRMITVSDNPVMGLGELGCFDEFGTMPCSVIKRDDIGEVWMYYVGWTRKVTVPYDCAIGLAISKDGGKTFSKYSNGPILASSTTNPFLLGCPRVYWFNNKWHMWYLGGTDWVTNGEKAESIYHLKLATSANGIDWDLVQDNVVPKKYENECQTCASIFEYGGMYHMYFTYRHGIDFRNPERGYRIGYAFSKDLKTWERNDEIGSIDPSSEGWDSEMICYPSIVKVQEKVIMFHCGNYFGKSGFGYAELSN